MTEKRNRWLINLILVFSVISFVGFSVFPLLTTFFEGNKAATTTRPTPMQSANATPRKEELEAQAKGYELVLQREPENQTALRGLLEARLGLGDIKGAIPPLEKLAKLNPNETDYSVLLAQAKQQTGDREGAAQTYRDILKTKPGNLNALDGLVTLLLQEKRPEAAIGLLQDTLKMAPQANQVQAGSIDVPSVQLLLGRVYAEQKRYDEALAVYDEAAKARKDDFRPVLAKAIVLKTQGKTEEAKPLFTTAASLAPAQYKDQINLLASAPAKGTAPGTSQTPAPGQAPAQGTSPASDQGAAPAPAQGTASPAQGAAPAPAPTSSPEAASSPAVPKPQ